MYRLTRFGLSDMIRCGAELRALGVGASSMEEVAGRTVDYFRRNFVGDDDEPAFRLVRFFKTHPFSKLEPSLKAWANDVLDGDASRPPWMKCLTLLATAGDLPEWNDRRKSSGHQAIPLPSEEIVRQAPMISQLIRQFGLTISAVLEPKPEFMHDVQQKSFNVFHVEEAVGSPWIPAQDEFVRRHGIRSALGFGGMLYTGDLFAVLFFSRIPISAQTADLFQPLALGLKLSLHPYADLVFSSDQGPRAGVVSTDE